MNDIQYKMTEAIAYELGKFDIPSFYSYAIWKINKEPFPYLYFFNWFLPSGTPCKNDENYSTDWENFSLHGKLKIESFTEIRHKLNYVRGRLKSYSVAITENSINVGYANSYDFRDFFAQCLGDVIQDKFVFAPVREGELERKINSDCPKYNIIKSERIGTIPGTPRVELIADKEIIDYIVGN